MVVTIEKWLWRLGCEGTALWNQLCVAKYNITNDGWDILMVQRRASGVWKLVMSTYNDFVFGVQFRVYEGSRVRFGLMFGVDQFLSISTFL